MEACTETRRLLAYAVTTCTLLLVACFPRSGRTDDLLFRGNVDASGSLDVTDSIQIIRSLFLGDPSALRCEDAADADDDETLRITDAVHILSFLFQGNAPPRAPFPLCGGDQEELPDAMGCESFEPCRRTFSDFPLALGRFASDLVIFVVDRAGHMQETGELQFVKDEIVGLIEDLSHSHQFGVIFFDADVLHLPASRVPRHGTPAGRATGRRG